MNITMLDTNNSCRHALLQNTTHWQV